MGQMITMDDLAVRLNVNKRTLYRLVQNGEIPGFKVGGSWRFDDDDISAWINTQKSICHHDLDESMGAGL